MIELVIKCLERSGLVVRRVRDMDKFLLEKQAESGWTFIDETMNNIKSKIKLSGYEYGAIDKIETHIGVKTGMNELFHLTDEKKNELDENPEYSWIFRRVYRGRDLENYGGFRSDGLWCIVMYDGIIPEEELKENMPKLYKYLSKYKEQLKATCKTCAWYEVQARDYHIDGRDRIIYGELGTYMKFARVHDNSICADTCYEIYGDKDWLDRIEKVFSSPFANNLYRLLFSKSNLHGTSRHNPDGISEWVIPINIPNTGDIDRDIIEAYGISQADVDILMNAFEELSVTTESSVSEDVNREVAKSVAELQKKISMNGKYSDEAVSKAIEMEIVSRLMDNRAKLRDKVLCELYGSTIDYDNELCKEVHLGVANCIGKNKCTIEESGYDCVNPSVLSYIHEMKIGSTGEAESNGAVYTPREIASDMAISSISKYIESHIDSENERVGIGAIVEEPILVGYFCDREELKRIGELLKQIRVCDMCTGCGIFPIEVAKRIIEIRKCINTELEEGETEYEIARSAIESIVGCDIDKGALRITKLRLSLLLAVYSEDEYSLVNLRSNFKNGNSLIKVYRSIAGDVHTLFSLGGNSNSGWMDVANKEIVLNKLKEYANSLKGCSGSELIDKKTECINWYFGINPPCTKWYNDEVEMDDDEIVELLQEIKDKYINDDIKSIVWELEFPEDALHGGFDIVIGNPPYIKIDKATDSKLMEYFPELCDRGADLCIYFYCMAMKLVKDKTGIVNMIMSNKWLTAKYGRQFRKAISSIYDIKRIVSYNGKAVFDNADVDVVELEVMKNSSSVGDKFEYIEK